MTHAALVGSTGLVGANILSQLLAHPSFNAVNAFTRRQLPNPTASTKLYPLESTDTSMWKSLFPRTPAPQIFFSGLGTTRAAAGGADNQRKIDLDLNYDLAKAAKDAGVDTYVLISVINAHPQSHFAYTKMKGELEEKVKELGFKHTIILRPGVIGGTRDESRPAEAAIRGLASGLKHISPAMVEFWCQDANVIARAAINMGLQCVEGKRPEGVWVAEQKQIVELAKEAK